MSCLPEPSVLSHPSRERLPLWCDPSHGPIWAGLYECRAGEYAFEMKPGLDGAMSLVLLRVGAEMGVLFEELAKQASRLLSTSGLGREPGQVVLPGALHQRLLLHGSGSRSFPLLLPRDGCYAAFTQRHPREFTMRRAGNARPIRRLPLDERELALV